MNHSCGVRKVQKKISAVFAVLLLIVFAFNGCGIFSFNSAENLIRPPKLSGDDGALQAAFEAALKEKGEYVLRYPSDGDYRSAFVRFDCDSDGGDEAFVFYTLKAEEMNIYMHILDKVNGVWTSVGEIQGDGNDIYSIDFSDLNNDGMSEVLVGWSSFDSKINKKLSVYASNGENRIDYRAVAIETYTDMYTVDLDEDGEKEIFIALINSTSDTYTTEARLLKMTSERANEYKMTSVGQVSLYSEITAIMDITSGRAGNRQYIYIDEAAGDTYLTEFAYWDNKNNTLVLPLKVDMISVSNNQTSRHLPLRCSDIDEDGEIEIPSTILLHDSSIIKKTSENQDAMNTSVGSAAPENIYIINWNKFSDGEFTVLSGYINNQYDGFRIEYNEEKMKDWSTIFYPDEQLSQFSMIKRNEDPETADETVLLFSIKAVEKEDPVSIGTYLLTGENKKYTYEITDEGEAYGITKSYITSIFNLSEN